MVHPVYTHPGRLYPPWYTLVYTPREAIPTVVHPLYMHPGRLYPPLYTQGIYQGSYTYRCAPKGIPQGVYASLGMQVCSLPGIYHLGIPPWVYRTGWVPYWVYHGRMGGTMRRKEALFLPEVRRGGRAPESPLNPFHCWSYPLS